MINGVEWQGRGGTEGGGTDSNGSLMRDGPCGLYLITNQNSFESCAEGEWELQCVLHVVGFDKPACVVQH